MLYLEALLNQDSRFPCYLSIYWAKSQDVKVSRARTLGTDNGDLFVNFCIIVFYFTVKSRSA